MNVEDRKGGFLTFQCDFYHFLIGSKLRIFE